MVSFFMKFSSRYFRLLCFKTFVDKEYKANKYNMVEVTKFKFKNRYN